MNYKDYKKIDVLNYKQLLKLGYDTKTYYCGYHKFEKIATQTRDKLKEHGIKFPFNPACFKHDILYRQIFVVSKWNLVKRLQRKFIVDLIFLSDMFKILNSKDYSPIQHKVLRNRAILFYFIVTFGVIFYILYLFFQKKGGKGLK